MHIAIFLKAKRLTLFFLVALFLALLTLAQRADAQDPWGHTVIMFPPAGATFSVPLISGARNCVYVTDCTENILSKPPVEAPQVVSDIPTPRDAYGWSFNVPIDRSDWTVEVDDEEPNGGATQFKAIAAIDGDPATYWHTTWSLDVDPGNPHHIIVDMKSEHWVDTLVYVPRPYDADKPHHINGNILDYEVWVSKDKQTWGRVAEGTFVYDTPNAVQTVELLIPNRARYVKLVSLSSMGLDNNDNTFAAASEIMLGESLKDAVISGAAIN
jgi:hypothetical protein